MTVDEYFGDWVKLFDLHILNSTISRINYLYEIKKVTPKYKDVFKAFALCPLSTLKVVILGQDPYPQKDIATGIAFANNVYPISPSLEVLKEAIVDYTVPHNAYIFDSTLESLERQGILMLNTALTVEIGKPGSHTMLWRPFISKFLEKLSNSYSGIAYLLLGKQAQTFEPYINKNINMILKEQHPSYYARTNKRMPSDVFKAINSYIKKNYGESINWFTYI